MQSITGRVLFELLVGCGLAAALPIAASAADIHLCTTSCDPTPTPLLPGTGEATFQATINASLAANSTPVDDTFINETGTIIDDLSFDTTIDGGLFSDAVGQTVTIATQSTPTGDAAFTCGDILAGFFMDCSVTYTNEGTFGLLDYSFSGVTIPTPGQEISETLSNPSWANLDWGIPFCPQVPPSTPNAATLNAAATGACEAVGLGVFTIEFDGWTTTGLTGLSNGIPTFTAGYNVPEPSAALILLTELLLLAGVLAVFGRKLNWKRRFDL
jgi:hypothetical protein